MFRGDLFSVGMKPLSERDENQGALFHAPLLIFIKVGMKPLSERDENDGNLWLRSLKLLEGRNEATL